MATTLLTPPSAMATARRAGIDRLRQADPGLAVLVLILAALTFARLLALALSPSELGFDEAQYWTWSREFAFGYFTKPPLIGWAIGLERAVCGDGAACVRAASPIVHMGSALLLYALGKRLYDGPTGFWSAIFFAGMPGIAVSSFLMTTDVFLIFFWCLALVALVAQIERPGLAPSLVFGLALGLGLNAKYAMVYLPVLAALYASVEPRARRAFATRSFGLGLLLGLALIAPNLLWNASHGFATFTHTSSNIGWGLSRINARGGFEFLAGQFGVVGPIVFGAILDAALFGRRSGHRSSDRLLLWFCVPVLAAITLQGFLSRANPNWGASAYPAGLVLATALILRHRVRLFFALNLALSLVVALGIVVATALYDPMGASGPFRQLRQLAGWSTTAQGLVRVAGETGVPRVVVVGRALYAGLAHPLRDAPVELLAFLPQGAAPADQFQLQSPWRPGGGAALLVGVGPERAAELGARLVGTIEAPIWSQSDRRMTVYRLPDRRYAPPSMPTASDGSWLPPDAP